jgi:hypothetical protein
MLVVYQNANQCVIRPVPFISITQNAIRNKNGVLGSFYDIVLNGTILPDQGSPYYITGGGSLHTGPASPVGSFTANYTRPAREMVDLAHAMSSIIVKQNLLRELFKNDGQKVELYPASLDSELNTPSSLSDEPVLIFYPTVQSISFEEGGYTDLCRYTINLRAEVLLDGSENIISDGLITPSMITSTSNNLDDHLMNQQYTRQNINTQIDTYGGFVEDYSESWSIEPEEGKGNTDTSNVYAYNPQNHIKSIRGYRLTRNVTATGRTMHTQNESMPAWKQARDFIFKVVLKDRDQNNGNNSSGYEQYPDFKDNNLNSYFGKNLLNLATNKYGGFNHSRTESIDQTGGSYTVSDSWILSQDSAYEDYRLNLSRVLSDDARTKTLTKVSIEGNIKGLSSKSASATIYGGGNDLPHNSLFNNAYANARNKLHQITGGGMYGINSYVYKRAQNTTSVVLNPQPLSISINANEFLGEISYSFEYDNRSPLLSESISGVISSNVNYSDTYPGDIFAVIPVLGRQTGPVLQYIGGRTEYQRNLSIELVFDTYYNSGVSTNLVDRIRTFSVLSKPTLNDPFRSQINNLISAYSPAKEYGIRKYFLSPPTETWDAQAGRYSLNLNWTYELNR